MQIVKVNTWAPYTNEQGVGEFATNMSKVECLNRLTAWMYCFFINQLSGSGCMIYAEVEEC